MTDAKSATEATLYGELADAITGATVFQDVPEDEPYPLVVIGDMRSTPLAAKDDPDRRITVEIVSIVSAEERAPLLELQRQVEAILDGKTFAADGWTLAVSLEDDDALLAEDGSSYVGTSTFQVLALAA
jgi:hypothetical protein